MRLIQGDLLVVLGDTVGALARYRQASAAYAGRSDYPVEPATWTETEHLTSAMVPPPATLRDSGSQRDNWLLRRYIPLGAWSDADAEFARMWAAYRASLPIHPEFPFALQFAFDYSVYLRKRGQPDRACSVIEELIVRLDLDRAGTGGFGSGGFGNGGLSVRGFLEAAFGEFVEAHREQRLVDVLQRDARPVTKRTLAWVLLHQGKPDAALAKELEYIDTGNWNEISKALRRGSI